MGDDDQLEAEQHRKLFIGGLDFKTSEDTLKAYFQKYGEVVDSVIVKDTKTRRSRGFGFIAYKNSSMVDNAQKGRPHKIDGKEVETKRAVPRVDSGKAEAQVTVKKLFVGGVKDEIEESHLKEYFSQYGTVDNVNIVTEKSTGKKRGFAFVEFDDYDPVDKAVLKKIHVINNKRTEVKKALSKQDMETVGRKQELQRGRNDYGMRGNIGYGGGFNVPGGHFGGGYNPSVGSNYAGVYNQVWDNYGGGYNTSGVWSQGVFGSNFSQGGGGWGDGFGSTYGQSYGGGPLKGSSQKSAGGPYSA